jgi:hypothetical protein
MNRWCVGIVVGGLGMWSLATPGLAQESTATPASASSSAPSKKATPRALTDIEKLLGRPASIELLWQVIERDLKYGLIDQADNHLQDLLGREDLSGEKLLELREKLGVGLLVRIQRHPELAEKAKPLLQMLAKASDDRATDENRIRHFIQKLDDSASERAYAIEQLNRSGPLAVPFYIEALREKSVDPASLVKGMLALPQSASAPLAAALDADDESLLSLVVDLLAALKEPRSAEALYPLAGNKKFSIPLQEKARRAIAQIEQIPLDRVGSPVSRLIEIARHYDEDPAALGNRNEPATIWYWTGDNVAARSASVADLAEHLGLRAIRQALELDPENRQAKIAFLKLALDTSTLREGIDRPLPTQADGSFETALSTGSELLLEALDESLQEGRPALALSAVRALASTASPQVVAGDPARPSPLLRALDFPNSRVRFEAAVAVLDIHANQSFTHADRVVSTLAQAIDPRQRPTALILDFDLARGQNTAGIFQQIGYEAVVGISGNDGFKQASESGLVELLVVDSEIRDPDLIDTIETFQKNGRTAGVAVVVLAREPLSDVLTERLARYAHVLVIPPITDPKKLSEVLSTELADQTLSPWTEQERNDRRQTALGWLVRLARGEMQHVDIGPAIDPLTRILNDETLSPQAAEALSYLPSASVQASLAAVAMDGSLSATTRSASARALAKNIARGTNALPQAVTRQLFTSLDRETDPVLRQSLAAAVGSIDRQGKTAAERMKRYQPRPAEIPASSTEPLEPPAPSNEK